MANDDLKDRVARLPRWARDYIRLLEIRGEPMVEEAARARQKASALEARNHDLAALCDALYELIRCAARGGSDGAKVVMDVLDGYGIFPVSEARDDAEQEVE